MMTTTTYPPGTDPRPMRVTVPAGLNLRAWPTTSIQGFILRTMPRGELVTVYAAPVVSADGYEWVRVVDSRDNAGWCARTVGGRPSFEDALPPAWTTALTVPYVPQQGVGANYRLKDCGAAAAISVFRFRLVRAGFLDPVANTVDAWAAQTSLAYSDSGLTCTQVAALLRGYGVAAEARTGVTLDDLRSELHAERPPICLVNYKHINPAHPGDLGHYVVLTACSSSAFRCHDAYLLGADVVISNDALAAAMRDVGAFAVGAFQAVVVT